MKVFTAGIGTLADPNEVWKDAQVEREDRIRQKHSDELRQTCERMEARVEARMMMRRYHLPMMGSVRSST